MNLVWFTNDLRVADNSSLTNACNRNEVMGVYFFDPRHYELGDFGFKKTEKYRAKFLLETIACLKEQLADLNISLLVFHGRPEVILPSLVKEYQIKNIYLQNEWTTDENLVLDGVIAKVPALVNFEDSYDQFLFHPKDIPYTNFDSIPEVFTNFRKKCEKHVTVLKPLSVPAPRPKENLLSVSNSLPSLKNLGLEEVTLDSRSAFPFKGGEAAALDRIKEYFWESGKLAYYNKTRNGLVGKDYSSKLSAWIANGSISARTIYWEVQRFEREVKKNQDTYWLVYELIWRDYFKYISLKHGDKIFHIGEILDKYYDWQNSTEAKNRWISGNTNEPFVNANMKEIAMTGWMSNRGRQNVASFWAKELEQDWRIGAAYFESMLIDYDVHSNWGNWMYNSGVGNDPRNRKFNIKRQSDMYDSNGKFQNLWLQEKLF